MGLGCHGMSAPYNQNRHKNIKSLHDYTSTHSIRDPSMVI